MEAVWGWRGGGSSVDPNDMYMHWARIRRKQVSLGEKWSIAGGKKFNHNGSGQRQPAPAQAVADSPVLREH